MGHALWRPRVHERHRPTAPGDTLSHQFSETLERAGLRSVRFHDLRHGAATLMLASGTDLKVVSEVLGHSTIATTANVYAGVLNC